MFVTQSLEDPHGGVSLFSMPLEILGKPLSDESG